MLNILNKKIKNSKCKIISFLKQENDPNQTIFYPPASKEWFNSIYAYNKNFLKSLPVVDKIIIKLIKSYFNFYNRKDEIKVKLRRLRTRFRRLSINKIFVSRAELKHFTSKVIITIYVYNRQKRYFLNKLWNLNTIAWLKKKAFIKKIKQIKKKGLKVLKKVKREKNIFLHVLKKNTSNTTINFKNNFKQYEKQHYENFIEKSLEKEILGIYYKHLLYFNKSKFQNTYLLGLNNLISKIYNKKVEFNIVNLKYLYLNSDILSESICMKIKNRDNRLYKILKAYLNIVKLPYSNKLIEKNNFYDKSNKALLLEKTKNLNANSIFSFKQIKNKDPLNQLLEKVFLQETKQIETKQVETKQTEIENQSICSREKSVLSSLKYKVISGVRMETTGRLSRRLTASRSVFKLTYKGNIRNIDSSYKGLSSVMLRGYAKSNLQFTKINSKTRNGSFGIKGWVSSK